jgi:hypothetical protein
MIHGRPTNHFANPSKTLSFLQIFGHKKWYIAMDFNHLFLFFKNALDI